MNAVQRLPSRRWLVLFLVAIGFQFLGILNSDLGLDTHVRLNAMSDVSKEGHDLAWGPLRLTDSSSQGSGNTAVYDGYIPPWNTSPLAFQLTAAFSLGVVALLAAVGPKDDSGRVTWVPAYALVVLLSPVFLFATSRGYDEAILALFGGVALVGFVFGDSPSVHRLRLHVAWMATSLLPIMAWKGFPLLMALGVWLGALVLGMGWVAWHQHASTRSEAPLTSHPWVMAALASTGCLLVMVLLSLGAQGGTFVIVFEEPLKFLLALFFAVVDAVGLYLLIGLALWPLISEKRSSLLNARSPELSLLTMYISGLLTAIVFYIAALWTLESTLWERSMTEIMVVLGNNGRYATCLVLPILMVLKWPRSEGEPTNRWPQHLTAALAVLVPFILLTSLIGHQLWSEDAGAAAAEVWQDDDEQFLLIAPETLAMHHLYVMKTHLDLDGTVGVQGHWRTEDTASTFLLDASPDLIVLAPHVTYSLDPLEYELVGDSSVPITVPGGIQSGGWQLYRSLT